MKDHAGRAAGGYKRDAVMLQGVADGAERGLTDVRAASLDFLEGGQRYETLIGEHFLRPSQEGAGRTYLF